MNILKSPSAFLGVVNNKVWYTITLLALSQFNFGFETGAFNAVQAMDDFIAVFGTEQADGLTILTTQWLSLFNGLSIVGFAIGVIVGNTMTDMLGRRKSVMIMCVWTIICTTIIITARSSSQMLAGRCLNYLYIGMELAIVPLYQAEVAPLQVRGAAVATYNTALAIGGLVMAIICRATSPLSGHNSWLIPLGLFYVFPSIVLAGSPFLPESPRWLVAKGRETEAAETLRLVRQGKFSEEEIEEEMAGIIAASRMETESETPGAQPQNGLAFKRWLLIFSPRHRQRTFIVLATNFFLHGTGNAFRTMYGTIFLKSLGSVNPFSMNAIGTAIIVLTCLVTLVLVDVIGRRPLLLYGSALQAASLLVMGGLGTVSVSEMSYGMKSGIVTVWMLFGVGYTAAWGQLAHTITSELPSAEVRDLTYATGSLLAIIMNCIITFALPYLLNEPYAGLGSQVGFIFGALGVVSFVFAFFCVPDCLGKSLEDIDFLFASKVPIRAFGEADGLAARFDSVDKGNEGGQVTVTRVGSRA